MTEIWYLLITGKVLFWTFRWWEIRSFFESRSLWKDDIHCLLRSICFELFGNGKYGIFFSQKVDGKMIFTWSLWAFYDIPGPGKYGFSRSEFKIWSVKSCFNIFCNIFVNIICFYMNNIAVGIHITKFAFSPYFGFT